jgi:hypothetical protein
MKDTKQSNVLEKNFLQPSESILRRMQKLQQEKQLVNTLGNKQASLLQEIYGLIARTLECTQVHDSLQKKKRTINTALKNAEALCGAAIAVNQQRLQLEKNLA